MTAPRPGDRIRLVSMPDEPNPVGSTGTVTFVNQHGSGPRAWLQIGADWDILSTRLINVAAVDSNILESSKDVRAASGYNQRAESAGAPLVGVFWGWQSVQARRQTSYPGGSIAQEAENNHDRHPAG